MNAAALAFELAKLCSTYGSKAVIEVLADGCDACMDHALDRFAGAGEKHIAEGWEKARDALAFAADDVARAEKAADLDLGSALTVLSDTNDAEVKR